MHCFVFEGFACSWNVFREGTEAVATLPFRFSLEARPAAASPRYKALKKAIQHGSPKSLMLARLAATVRSATMGHFDEVRSRIFFAISPRVVLAPREQSWRIDAKRTSKCAMTSWWTAKHTWHWKPGSPPCSAPETSEARPSVSTCIQ